MFYMGEMEKIQSTEKAVMISSLEIRDTSIKVMMISYLAETEMISYSVTVETISLKVETGTI